MARLPRSFDYGAYEFYNDQYFYDRSHYIFPSRQQLHTMIKPVEDTDMNLREVKTEDLKAELQRREEREALLKKMTWKNVMLVRLMPGKQWDMRAAASTAANLGYEFFVCDTYPNVYRVRGATGPGWNNYEDLKSVSSLDVK